MAKIWVVLADSSKARIFETESRIGAIRERERMDHEPARAKVSQLVTDGTGTSFDRSGPGRHRVQREIAPKEHEARVFARALAARLDREQRRGTFQRLVLVSAPRFLGYLRPCLSPSVRATLAGELCKDLVNVHAQRVRERLPARL